MLKTVFDEFIADPKRRRIYEREALALRASELIFELMENEHVSKADLADILGASRAHVSQLLSGSRNMTIHTLADLAFVLGHKIDLVSIPLAGRRSTSESYVPLRVEKQEALFGMSFPGPELSPNEGGEELEDNLAIAA